MVNPLPPVPGTGGQTQQGGVDYMQGQADVSQVGSTTNTTQDPNVVVRRVGANQCFNYLDQQVNCDGSGPIGGTDPLPPPPDTGGGRNFQQECEAMGNVWDTATQTCNSPAGTPNPADQCPEGQRYIATLGCVNDGPGPCPEGTYQDPWGRGCLPKSYPYGPPRGGECPEGQMIGPNGTCVPIDENNYIVQPGDCLPGQVKGVNGNCINPGDMPDYGGPDVPDYNYQQPGDLPISPSPLPEVPNEIGGVSPTNPNAQPLDYDALNPYIDAAWNEALRTIEPTEQLEDDRFKQELINQGIDPNSPAGEREFDRYKRAQADRRNSARFQAMEFGRDTQSQMFDQALGTSQLANNLAPVLMNLQQQGHEFDIEAMLRGDQQTWDQVMDILGLERQDYYDWRDESRYMDAVIMALIGLGEAPSYSTGGGLNLGNLI